ncbi:MAG: hypothetical protein M1840_001244 [Geoglossum simile]|nr:MAG: hypothetical protein M1840_001244 [Geoglossum simile]
MRRNDVAVLLEEHTPEIFEISLGNIPAQAQVKIETTYVNELGPDIGGEGVLVTIPTSIAPRYGTPEGYAGKSKSSLTAHDGMEIRIEVSTPVPIRKLESRTHPISVELGSAAHPARTSAFSDLAAGAATVSENRRARATLSSSTPVLGRDFVLLILVHGPGLLRPRAVAGSCPRHPRSSAIQVAFRPQDLFFSQLPQDSFKAEVIFIADRSGSMDSKISSLRRSLGIFLQSLPKEGLHFNVASFGSNCSLLWPQSQPYNQETLTAAHQHLGTFDASMGGTEILAALQKAVNSRLTSTSFPTDILIPTDGEVWDVDATVDFVRSTREKLGERIRFFALGIGDTISHKLVEGIGRYGGGFADVHAVSSPGSWDTWVVRMLKGALFPSGWTCQITPKVEQGKPLAAGSTTRPFIKAPYKIPPLLNSIQAISYCLVDDSYVQYDSISIHGISSSGQNATVDIPIKHVEVSEPTILHLAAKAVLADMGAGKSQLHDEAAQNLKLSNSATNAYIRRNGERLGKKWSITGKWTSFIGTNSSNRKTFH